MSKKTLEFVRNIAHLAKRDVANPNLRLKETPNVSIKTPVRRPNKVTNAPYNLSGNVKKLEVRS